jgi:hypothetical protein
VNVVEEDMSSLMKERKALVAAIMVTDKWREQGKAKGEGMSASVVTRMKAIRILS